MCLCCRRLARSCYSEPFSRLRGEASGYDVDFVAKQNVGPQIDVARLKMTADEAGGAGKNRAWAGNVVARIVFNLPANSSRWRAVE